MFVNARQLQDQFRATGKIILPAGARLTPLAVDFVRTNKLAVDTLVETSRPISLASPISGLASSKVQYWFGTTSGVGKAAVLSATHEHSLSSLPVAFEATQLITAIREIRDLVANKKLVGAILVVDHAGAANVLVNRVSSLRAVVATSLASLTHALNTIAANVLIIEPGSMPLGVMKNLVTSFLRGVRPADVSVERLLAEVTK